MPREIVRLNGYSTENIGRTNAAEWDAFVCNQPNHNAFQSASLLMALENNSVYRGQGRLWREQREGTIAGGYILYVINEMSGLASLLATRAICNAGPLVAHNHGEILRDILADMIASCGSSGTYLELWNNSDQQQRAPTLATLGFVHSPHLNYHISLDASEEILWNQIQKRKRRYIRSNEASIAIKMVESTSELDRFYAQLEDTYSRVRVPLIDKSVFKQVWQAGLGKFLLAEYEGQTVGSRVALPFGNSIYDWYAGSSRAHDKLHVNESLVWWILKWGHQSNYRVFDFGGAGKPDKPYGPRDFKSHFGGQLVNYGRDKRVLSVAKNVILEFAMAVREKTVALTGGNES